MSLQALRTELDAGHPNTGAYSADDGIAASEINAINRSRVRAITIGELREWAAENARAYKLHQAQESGATDQVKNLAIIGMAILNAGQTGLDPSNQMHVAMVNGLVAGGVWNVADREALISKATDDVSRANELGFGRVKRGHIQMARAM